MNFHYRVLLLVAISIVLVVVNLKAEQPNATKLPNTQGDPEVTAEEVLDVLTSSTDNAEVAEPELLYFDSELNKKGCYTPFKQCQNYKDSITPFGIPVYIQFMKPVIQKLKNEDIEMIEIL